MLKKTLPLVFLCVECVAGFGLKSATTAHVQVDVPKLGTAVGGMGTVTGADEVAYFKGIPYAKAPVDDLRWRAPQPHGSWGPEVLNATEFGAECYQFGVLGGTSTDQSEDCLFLNIATPVEALDIKGKRDLLPVFFWIHGGAYMWGTAADFPADAPVVSSKQGVVVVTANYRINGLGFLGSEELRARSDDGSVGSYGIQDQRMAMEWVKENIEAFGGDPERVTIIGQSAGGNSVMNHLARKASFPFYQQAVMQSGTYSPGSLALDQAQENYDNLMKELGCDSLECMLGKDGAAVAKAAQEISPRGWLPVYDGVFVEDMPWELIKKGDYNTDAKIIIGSDRDENGLGTIANPDIPDDMGEDIFDAQWPQLMDTQDQDKLAEIKQIWDPSNYVYPDDLGNYSQWWWELVRATTDSVPGLGACAARTLGRMFVENGNPSVYMYLHSAPVTTEVPSMPGSGPGSVVVVHSSEIFYTAGLTDMLKPGPEVDLAKEVAGYWTNFAISGDPNVGPNDHSVEWTPYSIEEDNVIRFERSDMDGIYIQNGLRKEACDWAVDNQVTPIVTGGWDQDE